MFRIADLYSSQFLCAFGIQPIGERWFGILALDDGWREGSVKTALMLAWVGGGKRKGGWWWWWVGVSVCTFVQAAGWEGFPLSHKADGADLCGCSQPQ